MITFNNRLVKHILTLIYPLLGGEVYKKMGGTRFMVQWEEHPSHLATRLGQLLEHQTLVDVTLMCNTHTLRVHRAVLAACSPYFEVCVIL